MKSRLQSEGIGARLQICKRNVGLLHTLHSDRTHARRIYKYLLGRKWGNIFFLFFLFQGEFKTVAPGEGLAVRPFSAREC